MLTYNTRASIEGISSIARSTGTCRIMINNLTTGLNAACARTRIDTLLILTVQILGTVRANNALGSTVGCRANETGLTGAHGMVIYFPTLTVGTAG